MNQIKKGPIYKKLEQCLGSHWSLNLIALGLYIQGLDETNQLELIEKDDILSALKCGVSRVKF